MYKSANTHQISATDGVGCESWRASPPRGVNVGIAMRKTALRNSSVIRTLISDFLSPHVRACADSENALPQYLE
jgi:hypothetical protein